jgi:hypothetical protein
MAGRTLIIFDYSGTLSTRSVLFGRPARLRDELYRSGLAALGVEEPAVYWERIVGPTWRRGSTSPCGYRALMEEAVAALQPQPVSARMRGRIAYSVDAFVEQYLHTSSLDLRWRPLLDALVGDPAVQLVIATDHYAEATGAIIQGLGEWSISAVAVWEIWSCAQPGCVVVANSSDLGVLKTDPSYWQMLKKVIEIENLCSVIIVDDFGKNEWRDDRYHDATDVAVHQERTAALLRDVFAGDVTTIPFLIPEGEDDSDAAAAQNDRSGPVIAEVSVEIQRRVADQRCE